MKRSKFTEAQIAFILRQGEEGTAVGEICRKAGISEATYVGDECQALARAIVDHDEDAQATAIDELIGNKSTDQRSSGHCGTSIGARVPKARGHG
jgi:putative transposase